MYQYLRGWQVLVQKETMAALVTLTFTRRLNEAIQQPCHSTIELYSNIFLPNVMGNDNALQLFSGAILEIHRLPYTAAATFSSDEPAAVKHTLEEKYLNIYIAREKKRGKKVLLQIGVFYTNVNFLCVVSFAEDILKRD